MKKTTFWCAVRIAVLMMLTAGGGALAQAPTPRFFSGLINDYTPQTGGGPWEIRGAWSLTLNHNGTADFSAALNMTHDDYWVQATTPSPVNDNTSTGRNPHTHHITLTDASVSSNVAGCTGLLISNGTLSLTGNGNGMFAGSGIDICITGGNAVPYSNVTLTFLGPATMHFGVQAIHGVVRKSVARGDHDDQDGDQHDGRY